MGAGCLWVFSVVILEDVLRGQKYVAGEGVVSLHIFRHNSLKAPCFIFQLIFVLPVVDRFVAGHFN